MANVLGWISLGFDVVELVVTRVQRLRDVRAGVDLPALGDADVRRILIAAHAASPKRCKAVSSSGNPCQLAEGHATRHASAVAWFDLGPPPSSTRTAEPTAVVAPETVAAHTLGSRCGALSPAQKERCIHDFGHPGRHNTHSESWGPQAA